MCQKNFEVVNDLRSSSDHGEASATSHASTGAVSRGWRGHHAAATHAAAIAWQSGWYHATIRHPGSRRPGAAAATAAASARKFRDKLVTTETTLALDSVTVVTLRVHMHRGPLALLEVNGPDDAERAVVRRALVAITDVQAIVNVHLTVNRDDQAEAAGSGRVNADLCRAHVVASFGSYVVTLTVRASTLGVKFVVACRAPLGEAAPAFLECLCGGSVGVETNVGTHLVAPKTAFGLNPVEVV